MNLITWNYLEVGHGKGAPDGVGAVMKHTADQNVLFGNDIGTIEEFYEQVHRKVKNVKILKVLEEDIASRKFPSSIKGFRGSMSVHQVIWSANCLRMVFRKLSCFLCDYVEKCSHGYHLGNMELPPCNVSTEELQDFINNTAADILQEITNTELHNPEPANRPKVIPELKKNNCSF